MKKNNVVTFALASTLCVSAWIGVSAFSPKAETNTKIVRTETATASLHLPVNVVTEKFSISEKGKKLIKEKLTLALRKVVYGVKRSKANEFMSRCPSGVHDNIMKEPLNAGQFYYGEVRQWEGCAEKLLCEFRLSSDETTLQVWDNTNKAFTNAEKWIPAQTQAKLSRGKERELTHLYQETENEQSAGGKN